MPGSLESSLLTSGALGMDTRGLRPSRVADNWQLAQRLCKPHITIQAHFPYLTYLTPAPNTYDKPDPSVVAATVHLRGHTEETISIRSGAGSQPLISGRKVRLLQALKCETQLVRQQRRDGRAADEDELEGGVVLAQRGRLHLGRRDREVPVAGEGFL